MKIEEKKLSVTGAVKLNNEDLNFHNEVAKVAGTSLSACLTCRSCSGGCPMYNYMDQGPDRIMRLVVLGLKDEALKSNTIWRCLGCHACAAVCPMAINIAGVMDYLRHKCIEDNVPFGDKNIFQFHSAFLNSVRRHGRSQKVELMVEYKLRTLGSGPLGWFQDAWVGTIMILKRRLHFLPSRVMTTGLRQIRKILNNPWRNR